MSFLNSVSKSVSIDLGTANTLIYIEGKGIVLNEPSVIAVHTKSRKILAVGSEAKEMVGRTPENIEIVHPIVDGVIADYDVAEQMLRYYINKAYRNRGFIKPRIAVCIPWGITEVEKKAVIDAVVAAGAREAVLIEEPMASAIGAGIPTLEPQGNLVVDIGGGTTEVALISLGGIVLSQSIRTAGNAMDEAIVHAFKSDFNLLIGLATAEDVKIKIGSAMGDDEWDKKTLDVQGRDLVSGLPSTVIVSASQVREMLRPVLEAIVDAVLISLGQAPPELAADIMRHGIYLCGGGARLHNLDKLLEEVSGMKVMIPDNPDNLVVIGANKYLSYLKELKM